jgi:hypothetical protein
MGFTLIKTKIEKNGEDLMRKVSPHQNQLIQL